MRTRLPLLAFPLILAVALASPRTAHTTDAPEAGHLQVLEESERDFRSALAAHRMGDLAAAERGYRAALEKDPRFAEALVNLARVLAERHVYDEAQLLIERALHERHDYAPAWTALGLVQLRRGQLPEATDALNHARQLAPEDVETLTNLGASLIWQGFVPEAVEVLAEALRLDPDNAGTAFNLAYAYDLAGHPVHANYLYRRFLELAPLYDSERARVLRRLAELERFGETRAEGEGAPPPWPVPAQSHRVSPEPSPVLAGSGPELPQVDAPPRRPELGHLEEPEALERERAPALGPAYEVLAAVYGDETAASTSLIQLIDAGFDGTLRASDSQGTIIYEIHLDPYESLAEARQAAAQVEQAFGLSPQVLVLWDEAP